MTAIPCVRKLFKPRKPSIAIKIPITVINIPEIIPRAYSFNIMAKIIKSAANKGKKIKFVNLKPPIPLMVNR